MGKMITIRSYTILGKLEQGNMNNAEATTGNQTQLYIVI